MAARMAAHMAAYMAARTAATINNLPLAATLGRQEAPTTRPRRRRRPPQSSSRRQWRSVLLSSQLAGSASSSSLRAAALLPAPVLKRHRATAAVQPRHGGHGRGVATVRPARHGLHAVADRPRHAALAGAASTQHQQHGGQQRTSTHAAVTRKRISRSTADSCPLSLPPPSSSLSSVPPCRSAPCPRPTPASDSSPRRPRTSSAWISTDEARNQAPATHTTSSQRRLATSRTATRLEVYCRSPQNVGSLTLRRRLRNLSSPLANSPAHCPDLCNSHATAEDGTGWQRCTSSRSRAVRDARCRRCADARTRSLLPRPCTEWLPPPHPHAAAHAPHSSRSPSQRSKPLMCSLDCSSVLPRRRHACRWRAAETRHLALASRQTQPARSHQQRAARASRGKHTHKQSGPAARRAQQPASRALHACTRGVDTHSLLSVHCLSYLAAAATAAAGHSPGSAVLLSQPHRAAASFPPERFSPAGQSGLLSDAAPRQSHWGHSSSPIRSAATTPARGWPNLRVVATPQPLARIDHTAGLG